MKYRKVEIAVITGMCLITTVLSACTTRGRTVTPRNQVQNTNEQILGKGSVTPAPYTGQRLSINQGITDTGINTTPGINDTKSQVSSDNPKRAETIKNQLSTMKELKQVNVFVIGNAALVGYSPAKQSQDINATKNVIINKVKETDKNITNVTVSESADVMTRISNLTKDMAGNRPLNEITNDFNNIVQSLAPVSR